jgi:hypothetical protein
VALALLLGALRAPAQVFPFTTIQRVSVAPQPVVNPDIDYLVTLGQSQDGSRALVARTFDKRTGFQVGSPLVIPLQFDAVDVLMSTVIAPGSALVLDSARRVHVFPLAVLADGSVRLAERSRTLGPFGPVDAGAGTVLGEAPNAASPDRPLLGMGTSDGLLIIAELTLGNAGVIQLARGAIQDVGAVAQVGYFALAAVSGGAIFVIDPEYDLLTGRPNPRLAAAVRDPRPVPLIDFSGRVLRPDSRPVVNPDIDYTVVAANGTTELAVLQIPTQPRPNDTATIASLIGVAQPVKQVVSGSLSWLPVDGSAVLYNAGFTFEDGLVGRVWTIAGASMQIDPPRLNLRGPGRLVTVRIEAENQRAADIDLRTLVLSVDGVAGAVPAAAHPRPKLLDFDGDPNVDLEVKFDRVALARLLRQAQGATTMVRASWIYTDGTDGTASAQVRVKR